MIHKLLFFTVIVNQKNQLKEKIMSIKIIKKTLENQYFSFNAMVFLPSEEVQTRSVWGLFTHGYTASKSDCISWAQRLADIGIPCAIFDLPGHHLGSYNFVNSFEDFKNNVHHCFIDAYEFLSTELNSPCEKIIFAGHSLGALLAIKALELDYFNSFDKLSIGVGIGISQHKTVHLFESSFYQKTLDIRRQLVDTNIDSDLVFPWIKEEKLKLSMRNHRIHLITGLDDVVVGEGGAEALQFNLQALDNEVSLAEPKKLPHHEPSMAATHIYSFVKKELNL